MIYSSKLANLQTLVFWQWCVIAGLAATLLLALVGWMSAPSRVVVDIPARMPNERIVMGIHERSEETVYLFAHHWWQQLNFWPVSGDKDYIQRIRAARTMGVITPRFYDQLVADYHKLSDSLVGRTRTMGIPPEEKFNVSKVAEQENGEFVVSIAMQVDERLDDRRLRSFHQLYPLRVVRADSHAIYNPYGLAIDGFDGNPHRMTYEE